MNIITTTPEEAEKKIKSFFNKKIVLIIVVILIIAPLCLLESYPALLVRIIIAIVLICSAFFGFAPNDTICKNIYKKVGLGCLPRFVAIVISLCLYVVAIFIGYKTNII
jgi:glucan phosphoethanolaminetransferase (alkaline phosphatase superfamily)